MYCSNALIAHVDEILMKPLAEYVSLTISRVVHHSDASYEPVPFMLKRLVSRRYHVGPDGAVIGSSPEADIYLPCDTGLLDKHVEIKWMSGMFSKKSNHCLIYILDLEMML